MGKHFCSVVPTKSGEWWATCTCRWRANGASASAQAAEEIGMTHMAEVEKTRAYIRRSDPSLKQMRDYYQRMAQIETEHGDPDTAALWQKLADEITHRLNDEGPAHEGQAQLW